MSLKNNCIYIGPSLLEVLDMMEEIAEVKHLHICKVSNNYVSFEDCEVDMTFDEFYEILQIIKALPSRDATLTIRDEGIEDEEVFPLTNLTINFV